MVLMDLMDDCKISRLGVHCLGQILCEVRLPKAIEFPHPSSHFRTIYEKQTRCLRLVHGGTPGGPLAGVPSWTVRLYGSLRAVFNPSIIPCLGSCVCLH